MQSHDLTPENPHPYFDGYSLELPGTIKERISLFFIAKHLKKKEPLKRDLE